ncbi:hypothetical protein KGA66_12150 [Actinocrinis puniceicyclus]|uniref:Uncharacterized protein n=1 Tax=Actinocrinis puniceicyclus TaxID=977794 RepID=A0A8J8BCS2_9ACTN|nr:hypothetical protein [Actinocrinis puniceicyclus]MBS2963805.1 hypothetical protein [Actinocrinis puniceicyclus]
MEQTDVPTAVDGAPRIVTRLRGVAHGHAVLSRLAVGDRGALSDAGLPSRRPYDTQRHAWGLGHDRANEASYLVSGGPHRIDWSHPALRGLEPLGHTRPRHRIDPGEVRRDLAPTLAGALSEWLVQMAGVPLGFMPGDLWYLFPSNADLGAAYAENHQEPETLYTPFRLGQDGWLSAAAGPTVNVQYGPVLARPRDDAADIARRLALDPRDEASMQRAEEACLLYLWAPITFRAGEVPLVSGVLQVDPVRGSDGRAPQFAWFRPQSPNGLRSRAQVRMLLANVCAGR